MNKAKKLFPVIFVMSFLFFIQPINTLAVEGTCSWHDGVNCDAMADWDGSAVCKDGWRDSSEIYSSMQECKINRHYCTQTEANQIDLKYDTVGKLKTANNLVGQLEELNYQIKVLQIEAQAIPYQMQEWAKGRMVSEAGVAPLQADALRKNEIQQGIVNAQIIAVRSSLNGALGSYYNSRNQADKECYALGDEAYYKSQADYYKQLQSLQTQTQNTPQNTCQANSTLGTDNLCYCNSGYLNYNDRCISIDNYCKTTYGANSISTKINGSNTCVCDTGYVFNSTQTACNKVEIQSTQPTTIQTPPQQISPPKSTNSVIQNQSLKPKIKPFPISAEKTSITATISKTDSLATSSIKAGEMKQKVGSPKSGFFSKIKRFLPKLKFW